MLYLMDANFKYWETDCRRRYALGDPQLSANLSLAWATTHRVLDMSSIYIDQKRQELDYLHWRGNSVAYIQEKLKQNAGKIRIHKILFSLLPSPDIRAGLSNGLIDAESSDSLAWVVEDLFTGLKNESYSQVNVCYQQLILP